MAKRVDFAKLPVKAWHPGDTVAVYRKGKVVRIPVFGAGDVPQLPELSEVALSGKYSDLTEKPTLGTAAAKSVSYFATAEQGDKGSSAYGWGDHALAGYAQASAVALAFASKVDKAPGMGLYPEDDAIKLAGVASGATKNATDAQLRSRGSHTGTQPASTIEGLSDVAVSGKYTDLSDKPVLGSAAFKEVGVDVGDVMEVGAFGWGTFAPTRDIDIPPDVSRFINKANSAANSAPFIGVPGAVVIQAKYSTGKWGSQLILGNGDKPALGYRAYNSNSSSWTDWYEIYHTGNLNIANYYTKTQTESLVTSAVTGVNKWQAAENSLTKNTYHKIDFTNERTLVLPEDPLENDFVAILPVAGVMEGSVISRNGKTIMGLDQDMEIVDCTSLRLDYVDGSWRIV